MKKTAAKAKKGLASATTEGHTLHVDADGALVFTSKKGKAEGTLRLASVDPPETWRLAGLAGDHAVLALGEWLVWVDAVTRKTIRRVKARAKVTSLAADATWAVCGCEDGHAQVFDAATGEALASVEVQKGAVHDITLEPARLTSGKRAWDRAALAEAPRAGSPVTAIAAREDLVAAADKEGHVHLSAAGRPLASFALGQPILAVGVDPDGGVWAATARAVVRAARPWITPDAPLVLESPATAVVADASYVFAGNAEGGVDVLDRERAAYVTSYALSDTAVTAALRLPGKLLVAGTGGLDGRVYVVDVTVPKVVSTVEMPDEGFGVTALAADPRGRLVAVGSDAGAIALLDPNKGRVLARLSLGETPVSLAFDGTGRQIACALADGTACIVTLAQGGAEVAPAGLRGVTCVGWGSEPVVAFADGHVTRLSTAAPPGRARASR